MLVVADDPVRAERVVAAGKLACPSCRGELRPWGWARRRPVIGGDRVQVRRPRRTRCRDCGATHVLLPAGVLLDRAYSASVIGQALTAAARGWGHRRIAAALGVPAGTVRGWLRRLRARAEALAGYFTQLAYRLDARLGRLDPPHGWRTRTHAAVGLLAAATAAYERRFGPTGQRPWQLVSAVSSGLLLANTSRPFPNPQPVTHPVSDDLDAPVAAFRP